MKVSSIVSSVALATALALGQAAPSFAEGACNPQSSCFDSGRFATEITGITASWNNTHREYYVRVNFRVQNNTPAPLMLGFRWRSAASLVDNFGNLYSIDWKFHGRIVGIGILSRDGADASFVVVPGGSRTGSLVFSRWPGKDPIGDSFNADFSLEQLAPVPGNNQVRTLSTHALNFQNLRAGALLGGNANDVAQGLGNLFNALTHK